MGLASTRSALLLETENSLAEAHGRVKALEKLLDEKEKIIKEKLSNSNDSNKDDKMNVNFIIKYE